MAGNVVCITDIKTDLQKQVLLFIAKSGGATDEQIASGLGMSLSSACARREELQRMGFVADSGEKRSTRAGGLIPVWGATLPK